ncbi:hypothetical protein P4U90_09190, partial [Cytobacillus kochii]|uniref:hypothetical protein n=1 Tax=Cytobacillus kochii TaxID=859143 RepID=UPI002E213000|nr:hypothetical protein [Cytobacillus kochii]
SRQIFGFTTDFDSLIKEPRQIFGITKDSDSFIMEAHQIFVPTTNVDSFITESRQISKTTSLYTTLKRKIKNTEIYIIESFLNSG